MLAKRASRVGRTAFPARRVIQRPVAPLVNVHPRIKVPSQATTALEPALLTLIPSLKKGRWDPSPSQTVAVLDPTVFKHPIRRDILHLCAVHHLDGLRQGSANTKTRGEVRGSGRKIRRQKGSGKARLGDAQSPMLRGGGVAFGPKPRDFSTKLPRKVIDMGMRVALSAKLKDHMLGVMTRLYWPTGKTRHLASKIQQLGLRKTLFVTGADEPHEGLQRAIGNIPSVQLAAASTVSVYDLLQWQRVVLDLKAVDYFHQTLKKDNIPVLPVDAISEHGTDGQHQVDGTPIPPAPATTTTELVV